MVKYFKNLKTFFAIFFFLFIIFQYSKSDLLFISRLGNKCEVDKQRKYCGDHLICNKTSLSCNFCDNNSQCRRVHRFGMFECLPTKIAKKGIQSIQKVCLHKNFLPDITAFDILAIISTFLCGSVAAAGGTGGGGIFVPLLTIFGQFSSSRAIPLSKAMIFGSSIFNFLVHFWRKHPHLNKPVIDYEAAMLLEPITLLGTTIGVLFNIMFPEWLVVILIVSLLGVTTIRTTRKGIKVYKKEMGELKKNWNNKNMNNNKIEEEDSSYKKLESTLTSDEDDDDYNSDSSNNSDEVSNEDDKKKNKNDHNNNDNDDEVEIKNDEEDKKVEKISTELKLILLEESSTFPIAKMLILVICWVVIFVIALIKGGAHGAQSIIGIPSCGWLYWILFILNFPIIIGISVGIGFILLGKHYRKVALGYKHHEGEIKWNITNVAIFPSLMIVAGILASLLGIGGGMVKGPLLLELGLETEVTAATSSFMILFTSSITTAQFVILGRLPFDYGILFFFNGFFAAAIGELIIGYPAHKFKLTFLLIFSISIVIGVATVLMTSVGVYQVILDFIDQAYMGFKAPC